MNLKSKYISGIVMLGFISLGCKKTLDINVNPNNPSLAQGTPSLVLPAAQLRTASRVGGELAIIGSLWGNYAAQSAFSVQYASFDSYNVQSDQSYINNVYNVLFSGGLKNYQFVIDRSQSAGDWNFYLMGTTMKAYTAGILVDLFDKIPYFEALKGSENLTPHFDDGYAIYEDLIKHIDTALNKDFTQATNTNAGKTDLIFGGDMTKWKQFANTLELKLYLRMVNAKPQEAQAGVQKIYARNIGFLDVSAGIYSFTDVPNEDNPLYEQNIRSLNTTGNLRASYTFVSYLEANDDPRITPYYGSTNPASVHQGDYTGTNPNYKNAALLVQTPTAPVVFLSNAESYFMQAEARERYFGGDQAQNLYNQGVLKAFANVGQSGNNFIAPGGAYEYPISGSLDQKIQAISTQKWASFPYGVEFIEGFFEKQRTGYPLTSPVYSTDPSYIPGQIVISKTSVLGANQLPRRFPFPSSSRNSNPNTPAPVPISTPVWWAKP